MQERHSDHKRYFDEQFTTTQKYVIPYINKFAEINSDTKILEVGCGLGGNMKPFLDLGCKVTGLDINQKSIDFVNEHYQTHPNYSNLTLVCSDIYKVENLDNKFDVVVIRDVIEHIPNQEILLPLLKKFVVPGGVIFVAFPPWQNPFGGHQQMLKSKFLSNCPWLHLLPKPLYKHIIKKANGSDELILLKEIGITIERFTRIIRKADYQVLQKTFYFINPNYEIKFHLKPRKLCPILNIPYLRNFFVTTAYYLLK